MRETMFANNEITERGLLNRALDRMHDDVTLDERMVWAHSIDRSIKDAASRAIPFRSRVAWPGVVLAVLAAGGRLCIRLWGGGVCGSWHG